VIWSPHLQRDIDTLEKIQRRATKRVAGLRSIPYATRLQILDLPTLQLRRRRGDLIWTSKILTNNESDELLNLFEFNTNIHLRGHRLKLQIQNFKTSVRSHFLPNLVFSDWNGSSDEIVNGSNPNIFNPSSDMWGVTNPKGFFVLIALKATLPTSNARSETSASRSTRM
jgi:ribonuclease P/MRP protein subunit RPP40